MKVEANGIRIEVDDQGPREGPVVLLIMGLGMQLIAWPQPLVQMLVDRGLRVVRFDNRDIGLSQDFDAAGVPNLALAGLRHAMHLPVRSPYALSDMAQDAVGVLDALGIGRAHVCGASMGGMIAQHVAARAPKRVASLTLMMTTSGARRLPQASWRVRRVPGGRTGAVEPPDQHCGARTGAEHHGAELRRGDGLRPHGRRCRDARREGACTGGGRGAGRTACAARAEGHGDAPGCVPQATRL